ncbi:MAG: hypothetical protein ACYCPR_11955 [Thermoplasmataceae archaeon]
MIAIDMREKQKLVGRDTYTPTDAPQVRSSVTLSLNREETLSEQSLKTPSNNPHVDLQSGMTGRDLRVPVINKRGQPIVIKGREKKKDVNIKKVNLVRYGKGIQFVPQFLPPLKKVVSLGGVR